MNLARAALLLPLIVAGCGYSTRYEAPAGIRTVAVAVFDNHTLYSGVERELTDAVVKEIASKTPLRIRKPAQAEALLSGVLEDYGLRVLRENEDGTVAEYELRVVASFKLTSLVTHRVLREEAEAAWKVDYRPKLGETEQQARRELLRGLARKIVSRALESW